MDTIRCLLGILIVYFEASSELSTNATSYCGERYLMAGDNNRLLDSPGYPYFYDNNKDCTWTLYANDDSKAVSVKVVHSALESTGCYDNVTAYDGTTIDSRMIWSWCGTETPNILSSGKHLTLRLQTDSSGTRSGFRLKYLAVAATCGEQLSATTESQDLYSPGYPYNYQNNLHCTWTIRTRTPRIKLEVIYSDLGYQYSGCTSDNVKVYDGKLNQLLGTICGHQTPTLNSNSSVVRIIFVTNGIGQNRGFHMKYTGVYDSLSCGPTVLRAYGYDKYLTLPGYPVANPSDVNCTWVIQTTYPQIKLEVTDTILECVTGSIRIYDGWSDQVVRTFCDEETPTYVSTSSRVRIVFIIHNGRLNQRFKLKYTGGNYENIVSRTCDPTTLTALDFTQVLTSPGYPSYYNNDVDCTWTLDAQYPDYVVSVEVTAFDIEYQTDCAADYVQAFDGTSTYARLIGTWCGTDLPQAMQSTQQYMLIKFHSNGYTRNTGFQMQYSHKAKSKDVHDSSTVGLMIGGISGGCLLLFGIVCFASYRARKNIRTQTSRHSNNARPTSTQGRTRRSIYVIGRDNPAANMAPATFTGPPSYDEVMASAQGHQFEAPPPYSSVGAVIPTVSPVNVMDGQTAGALADIPGDSIVNEMPKDEEVTVQDDVDEPGVDASDTQPILLTGNTSSDC